jgi:integrase
VATRTLPAHHARVPARYTAFSAFVGDKPLRAITLHDLQSFANSLAGKPGTRGRILAAELMRLRWSDLADAADGTLYVTVYGKGGKTRTVRVSSATGNVMRTLRADLPLHGYVFAGRRGSLNPSQAWQIVRAAAKRAGIEKAVSPHFLRHAHASHALQRGVMVTTVRDTLGHSSIAVTDRYAHARPEESSGLALAV